MNIIDLRGKLPTHKTKKYKTRRLEDIRSVGIHHSLTVSGSPEAFANYHINTNGWPGIAYPYVIDKAGAIYQCWDWTVVTYHVGNSNKHSIGICMIGDFRTERPSPAQYDACLELVRYLKQQLPNCTETLGHSQYPGYSWKACPVIDMSEFRRRELNDVRYKPQVIHERFRLVGEKLEQIPRLANGKINYSVTGTDVRTIKLDPARIRIGFDYQQGLTTEQIRVKNKAHLAFNFPFFYDGKLLGNIEDEDKVLAAAYGKMLDWHEFVVIDGKPYIGQYTFADTDELCLSGAPLLVDEGKEVWDYYRVKQQVQDDIGKAAAQRTWISVDWDGNLIVSVCDGRTKSDKGFTLKEMAKYAILHKARKSLNGDGGGSSTLSDETGILNANRKDPRVVHHAVLIYFLDDDGNPISEAEANKLIEGFLQPAYKSTSNKAAQDIIHKAADELRKQSGQIK